MNNLTELLQLFNVVTVMNVHVYKVTQECFQRSGILDIDVLRNINPNPLYLDTLTISNIKTSGPTKVFKAGLFNVPVAQYGNTMTIDMKDALGSADTLQYFFGLSIDSGKNRMFRQINEQTVYALEGEVKIKNVDNVEDKLYLFIPYFVPNGNLEIVADSGSNTGVFDLSGTLYPMQIAGTQMPHHIEYYSFAQTSIFKDMIDEPLASEEEVVFYTVLNEDSYSSPYILDGDDITVNVHYQQI